MKINVAKELFFFFLIKKNLLETRILCIIDKKKIKCQPNWRKNSRFKKKRRVIMIYDRDYNLW